MAMDQEMGEEPVKPVEPKRERGPMSGPPSLFRGKVRRTVSVTLTPLHHDKVNAGAKRTGLTRSDFIGLLIELYAEQATVPAWLGPAGTGASMRRTMKAVWGG